MALQLDNNLEVHCRKPSMPVDPQKANHWCGGYFEYSESPDSAKKSSNFDYPANCPSPQGMNVVKDIEGIIHSEEIPPTNRCVKVEGSQPSENNLSDIATIKEMHDPRSPNVLEVVSPILNSLHAVETNENIWQYRPNPGDTSNIARDSEGDRLFPSQESSNFVENSPRDSGISSTIDSPTTSSLIHSFSSEFMVLADQLMKGQIDCPTFHNAGKKLVLGYCARYPAEREGLVEEHQRLVAFVQKSLSVNILSKLSLHRDDSPSLLGQSCVGYSSVMQDRPGTWCENKGDDIQVTPQGTRNSWSISSGAAVTSHGGEGMNGNCTEQSPTTASTTTITTSSSLDEHRQLIAEENGVFLVQHQTSENSHLKNISFTSKATNPDLQTIASFIANKSSLYHQVITLQKQFSPHDQLATNTDGTQSQMSSFLQHQILAKSLLHQHRQGMQLSGAERLFLNRFLTHCKNMGLNVAYDIHADNPNTVPTVAHRSGSSTHTHTTNVNMTKNYLAGSSQPEKTVPNSEASVGITNIFYGSGGQRDVMQKVELLEERMAFIEQIVVASQRGQCPTYWSPVGGGASQDRKLELEEYVVQCLLRAPSLSLILCHQRGCLLFARCLRVFTPKNVESLIVNLLKSLKVILDFSARNGEFLSPYLWKIMESMCQSICTLSNSSLSQILDVCWLMPSLLTHEFSSTLLMKLFDRYFRYFLQCARVDEEYFRHHVRKFYSTVMKIELRFLKQPRADITGLLRTISNFMDANAKQAVSSRIQKLAGLPV